uniref:PTHB1 N-terminal domain-containing protein n=1 Tax=Phlebotomus papatasi TaxID=29031 RepID=A0A1B0DQ92_PHLPP
MPTRCYDSLSVVNSSVKTTKVRKMSLFRVITWWTTQCPSTSGFDSFSLLCGRLGLVEDGERDSIVVGSHSGHLSVFAPSPPENGATFSPTDILLEVKLPQPVIGLACGKFSSSRSDNRSCLAVLHPMKLSVFWLTATEGVAEHGTQFRLQLAYESILSKFAFSLCSGGFGGVKGKEFLCILHTDGGLKFFEQDGISYETQLPEERSIPAPMKYVSRIDCFVTVAPSGFIECFKYQDLAQSSDNVTSQQICPFWTFFIGESPLDIAVHQVTNSESVIIVLGEHNLFCLSDTGKIKFIKKLDYTAVCLHSFVIGWYWEPDVRLMIAIATEMGSLLIYEESKLIWSAQLPQIPVALSRGTFTDLSGGIVTLSDTGILTVGFLGSEPQIFKVPSLNLKQLTVEKAQKELEDLEAEIKSGIDFTDISLINATAERELSVNVTFSKILVQSTYAPKGEDEESDSPKMCEISVVLKASVNIDHIQVIVNANAPLTAKDPIHVFRDVEDKATRRLSTWIYMGKRQDPTSLKVTVLVSSINRQGIPRVTEKSIFLPIGLVYKNCLPQKEAKYKIVIETDNVGKGGIAGLFNEMQFEASAQAIAFKSMYSGISTTIVAAKNSNRYRIQSDSLESMSAILSLFLSRLQVSLEKLKSALRVVKSGISVRSTAKSFGINHQTLRRYWKAWKASEGELGSSATPVEAVKSGRATWFSEDEEDALKNFLLNYPDDPDGFVLTTWEESIAASVDLISHVGALSKNKGMDFEENYSFLVTNPFDLERLKRQLNNLFERIARMIQEGSVEIQEDSRKDVEISDWLNEASPTVMEN